MEQEPTPASVREPAEVTVQIEDVVEAKLTDKPEVEDAESGIAAKLKLTGVAGVNAMVWAAGLTVNVLVTGVAAA